METYIIIVTYNGMKWIERSLSSINGKFKTIVVDNASTDNTVKYISENYPDIKLFSEKVNLGFGQANNKGIKYALKEGAKHVFLLNQDAYIVDDALEELIKFQKENIEYGILSPIHVNEEKNKLDANFAEFMSPEYCPLFYSDHVLNQKLKNVYDVPFVNAAAWLISTSCIEKVGGFDPIFFHYGEDDNYCQRVIFHGFKIGVVPNNYIIHDRENRSVPDVVPFSQRYYRNVERSYKIRAADLNNKNAVNLIDSRKMKILMYISSATVKLKFKEMKGLYNEYKLLDKIKPEVETSRALNKKTGLRYLS